MGVPSTEYPAILESGRKSMNRVFGFVALVVSAAALAIVGWTAGEVERGIATAQSVGPSAPPEAAQPLGAVTGGCTVTKVKFKTDNTTVSTTSGSFVKMPGMSVSFVTTAVGCLKIELSAVARLGTNEVMYVRAMLDEAVGGLPG